MKTYLETTLLAIFIFFISCFKQKNDNKNIGTKKDTIVVSDNKIIKTSSPIINYEKDNEENANDEFISDSLFNLWKGKYILKQENQIDGWGRESVLFSELTLIKPDSCVFKNWLTDSKGKRYSKDDNYQEYIGAIIATPSKDSIEFYTKKVVNRGNNSLSPLLTLTKKNKTYYIYSLITSPTHNGVVEIPIEKQE